MTNSSGSGKLAFFLAGMGMGAVVALLLAPKTGEETRKLLARKAEDGRDYVSTRGKQLRKHAAGLIDKTKDLVAQAM